jgi:potassium efflux system protein
LVLAVLALAGYLYTAGAMIANLLQTIWMLGGLRVLHELAMRWLRVTRQRLAYEAAMGRREAEQEARESRRSAEEEELPDVEEPEADLDALSDESRKLLNTAIVFAGIVGFAFIWFDILPALRIFDQVSVWHHTITVDGVDKRLPITLANVALGLLFAVGTLILAKRFPAVLEIILMRRFDMPASSRYTVTTLTTYVIAAVGAVLVFNTLGASWSKIQWLVAALSVGIGFGLQEIVANFISGIIILFERPVRVGDFVSVGDTDGTVTRIRIRATTIRTQSGKELLVPNKEFITGRLLNWSLSDPTVRLVLPVGVAYGSDVRLAKALLREAAEENESVLDEPRPSVIFQGFGDNALTMMLRCFVDDVELRFPTISALNEAINDKFNQAGIVIAFPQRDLHFDASGPLTVRLEHAGKGSVSPGANDGTAGEGGKQSS